MTPSAASLGRAALAAGLIAGITPSPAQTPALPRGAETAPAPLRPLIGAWDFTIVGQPRSCTVTLGPESIGNGHLLRFPGTCRRALPILGSVRYWTVDPGGLPRFDDGAGKPVIAFAKGPDGKVLSGKGNDGQSYALDPKSYPRAAASPVAPGSAPASAPRATPVDPAAAPAADTLPGRYVMMRQLNREACRLVLNPGPANPAGRSPAAFDGPCGDTGLAIFDPAGWRYAAGRLTLIARKGHSVELVFENGVWRKDPALGAPLMLKKLPN